MKHRLLKSMISIMLILCMALSITGCKKNKTSESDTSNSGENIQMNNNDVKEKNGDEQTLGKGRYLEYPIQPDIKDGPLMYSFIPEGSSVKVKDKLTVFKRFKTYCQEKDGSWTQTDIDWLPNKDYHYLPKRIVMGEDGNEYIFFQLSSSPGNAPKNCILQKIGDTYKEIEIPSFSDLLNKEVTEGGGISMHELCNFAVTKEGDFILIYGDYVQYVEQDGTLRTPLYNLYSFASVVKDDKLYSLTDTLDSLNIYDLDTGNLETSISTNDFFSTIPSYRMATLAIDQNNTIYLQCYNGIYQLKENTTTFTQIVDGSLNSLCSETERSYEMFIDENGTIYNARMKTEEVESFLYEYVYDPDIDSFPSETITIYSLYEIPEIKSLITVYQNQNPNVSVDYYVAIDSNDENSLPVTDCLHVLNTQLLAGDGPDIIYLDGINIENFMEKGVLADITDTIESNQDIYDVIKHTFTKDGKIYAVPTRIQIPVLCGNTEAKQATGSISELADYSMTSNNKLFGGITQEQLVNNLYRAYKNELFDEDGSVNIDKVKAFLENMKTISDHSFIIDYEDCSPANSLYNVRNPEVDLGMSILSHLASISEAIPFSACSTMSTLNHNYYPVEIISLNEHSSHKEAALEYLKLALTEDSQQKSYRIEGSLAVNKKAVPSKMLCSNPMGIRCILIGKYYDMDEISHIFDIPYLTPMKAGLYVPLYDEIQTPYINDIALDDTLIEDIKNYLNNETGLEDTISDINSFLTLYNAE